ncbi:Dipeptidyl aminopeptidase/acylaminoacyl peptidase [Chryseobacterium indologenes]|uniref:alpha/beta hydrolase family protein n=1 Tax=Chryseobacterium indologenes TaxID=253 RepID=UPI0008E6C34A|nr:prolyl oligopeptidase family serine peptidase [Chryseobacterium indologenes]SFI58413.1 Dipeptidyl aminopeptidase/acylaminoacyl peptidase [Chryseobacterium indologenes]SUX50633.1 Prolyl oligopeptidase family [Chryseobacterium indologenes]
MAIKIKYLLVSIILNGFIFIPAQQQGDTLTQWKAKFATLGGVPKISSEGTWIGINKQYKLGGDSAYVVSTKDKTIHKIVSTGVLDFLNEEGVFGRKADQLQFLNLKTGKIYQYNNASNYYRLDNLNRYAIYSRDKHLIFYDLTGNQLQEMADIDGLMATDSKSKLYVVRQSEGKAKILETTGKRQEIVYSTENRISKIELTPSGKQLLITEVQIQKGHNQLTILDSEHDYKKVIQLNVPSKSELSLTEIQNGKYFLINSRVRFSEEQSSLVDIWYGNDPFVNLHKRMYVNNEYWLWDTIANKLQSLKIQENHVLESLNNARYFLTYLPRKDYNFNTFTPDINDAYIFDISTESLTAIGSLKQIPTLTKGWRPDFVGNRFFCSKNGRLFLASNDGKNWSLFSTSGKREALIEKFGLEKPVFTANSNQIYFESSDDLWKYDINRKKLTALGIAKGKKVEIKNQTNEFGESTLNSFLPEDSILLEVYDNYSNKTFYNMYRKGKWKEVVPETENRFDSDHLLFNRNMTSFYTLERNFNQPPTLYSYVNGHKNKLFNAGIKDVEAQKIKQKIYNFKAVGKNLRGILYYPIDYDPKGKYPMVVHIYQVQRTLSNDYLSPNNVSPVGFQIRTLLERGYFVYLPDIEQGKDGPGMSALECVNSALDALLKNPLIDQDRIALLGHSYGGYETNFIATQSQRFKTYVSGAGFSDLISSYHSYSYQYVKPFYFFYETGQFKMGDSVAEDKEKYLLNSPILNVENVKSPILLWGGKKDENVPLDQVMEFYIGLRRYQKQVIALLYKNGNHDFLHHPLEEKDRDEKILEWFDYFLKDIKDVPWINKQIKKKAPF